MSDENRIRLIASQPIRGRRLDKNGLVLADSRVKYSLIIKPQSVNQSNWEEHKLSISYLLNVIISLNSISLMSKNLNSNNFENDENNLNNKECDYKDLATRLKEIKITIDLLEKTVFK